MKLHHSIHPRHGRATLGVLACLIFCGITLHPASAEENPPLVRLTFILTLPPSTPADEPVYLSIDQDGWRPDNPALRLWPRPDGRRELNIQAPAGRLLHFLFCRGNWDTVEVQPDGTPLEGRRLRPVQGSTYELRVARWKDTNLSTIHGHVEEFIDPAFLNGRRCWIYLPPDYTRSDARYPVLYMLDGQNLFDRERSYAGEWEVDESLERMISAREVPPIIVVGIENAGTGRMDEYTPWRDEKWRSGGGARRFLRAVADTLKPAIDARYRTLAEAENTYLAGSSLGGLVSAWAAWTFGDVFGGGVGAVSPSYWWDQGKILDFARQEGRPLVRRFYQDMGTLESAESGDPKSHDTTEEHDDPGTISRETNPAGKEAASDAIRTLRAMQSILEDEGLREGEDLLSVEAEGHRHHERFWAQRFPRMVRFLLK